MSQIFLKEVPLGSFKGVLFDKDGTLTNSESYLTKIANHRIKETIKILENNLHEIDLARLNNLLKSVYGITSLSLDPHGAIAIASRNENLISTATLICTLLKNWPKAIHFANEIFLAADIAISKESNEINKRPLLPGVKNLLKRLNSAKITCALITNDNNKGIEEFLEVNGLTNKFNGYWSCENHPKKPDPNAVKEFCKKLNLKPSECLLIGDSDSDLKMARLAGIGMSIGYTSGWTITPELKFQQEIINDWDELTCLKKD